jgi:hypothetical protein
VHTTRQDLPVWCTRWLGAPPAAVLFEAGNLSTVRGLRLMDGREVVVKVRPQGSRLAGCAVVHRALWTAGFPCPEPLADLQPLNGWVAGLWQRAFDAKTCSLDGDPERILTRHEAQARLRLAGLNPDLAAEADQG